jgi:predicted Ser/Thr protein kinase
VAGTTPTSHAVTRSRAPVSGDLIAGRYELEELVGSGGMSSVFRARDRQLERLVAIKILHERYAEEDDYVERFRREARAVARLTHPNIVTVIDRGEDAGRQFIVFEYVDGENLKELVGRTGRLPLRRALELALAMAQGLAFAHENGLVHRDVKPQNVLLNGEGEVKVTDFGIARSLDVDHGVTQTGAVLGTSNYLAPEQANGQPVSPATDVYSLGVVLWELLTGDVPFPGDNFVAVALRHINEPPPPIRELRPDVPPRLAAVVERALEKDPRRRFPTMTEFAAELRRCVAELDDPAVSASYAPAADETMIRPAPVVPAPPGGQSYARPGRNRRLAYALAALLVAAIAFVLVVVLGGASHVSGGSGGNHGAAAGSTAVKLAGIGDYDPQGNGGEHSDTAQYATDGDSSTFWETEIYGNQDFGGLKDGLGLLLDAGSSVKLTKITVQSPTPGFTAQIKVGDSSDGPFGANSPTQTVSSRTTFVLDGKSGRYWVIWISQLPPEPKAEISEVTARK